MKTSGFGNNFLDELSSFFKNEHKRKDTKRRDKKNDLSLDVSFQSSQKGERDLCTILVASEPEARFELVFTQSKDQDCHTESPENESGLVLLD